MRSRAWSLAAACALGLVAVVALVAWRGPDVAGAWSPALRATAVIAVVALALSVLVAAAVALSPPPPDRVAVTVPPDAPPTTAVVPHPGPRRWLLAAVVLAVLGSVPVLMVLVLSATGSASAVASGTASAPTSPPAPTPASPPAADPTTGPGTSTDPSASTGAPAPTSPPASTSTSPPAAPGDPPVIGAPPAPEPPGSQPDPPPAPSPAPGCTTVVAQGDTLWDLARARLPPGVTPEQVAAATEALYAASASVVGSDPDLILPGQVLDACG